MRIKKYYWSVLVALSSVALSSAALSSEYEASTNLASSGINLGGVAGNLMSVEKSVHSLIQFICIASGVGLVIASIGLFYSHWQNPMNVPLSKPVSMFFLGFALIGLALIPRMVH